MAVSCAKEQMPEINETIRTGTVTERTSEGCNCTIHVSSVTGTSGLGMWTISNASAKEPYEIAEGQHSTWRDADGESFPLPSPQIDITDGGHTILISYIGAGNPTFNLVLRCVTDDNATYHPQIFSLVWSSGGSTGIPFFRFFGITTGCDPTADNL